MYILVVGFGVVVDDDDGISDFAANVLHIDTAVFLAGSESCVAEMVVVYIDAFDVDGVHNRKHSDVDYSRSTVNCGHAAVVTDRGYSYLENEYDHLLLKTGCWYYCYGYCEVSFVDTECF